MTSGEPGPGQKYALQAKSHIAALRAKEPNAKIEIRWCPSHQGIEGNGIADEWAKLAADELDAHGVEWLSTTNPDGSITEEKLPLPRASSSAMLVRSLPRVGPGSFLVSSRTVVWRVFCWLLHWGQLLKRCSRVWILYWHHQQVASGRRVVLARYCPVRQCPVFIW